MVLPIVAQIIAKNPPSILLAFGGIGFLLGIAGAGLLLVAGIFLQVAWLARFFI
jgi:hypothetical protein